MDSFIIMNMDDPQLKIEFDHLSAKSTWLTDEMFLKIPYSLCPENITVRAIEEFCETRVEPRTRVNIDYVLRHVYKMKDYFPIKMCRLSRGYNIQISYG